MDLILENPGNVIWWMPYQDNRVRLIKSSDWVNETLLYRPTEKSPFSEVLTTNVFERIEPVCFSKDRPDEVIAISNFNRDKEAVVTLDLNTGKENRVIFQHEERSEEHTSELQSLMRISYAVFCLTKKNTKNLKTK